MVVLNSGHEREQAVKRVEQKKADAERLTRPVIEALKAKGCPDLVELDPPLTPAMLNLLAKCGREPGTS